MPPASLPTPADVAARTLYAYVSPGVAGHPAGGEPLGPDDVLARALYAVVNEGVHGLEGQRVFNANDVTARSLYAVVNIGHDRTKDDVAARALYEYAAYDETELFPWIEKIAPSEALPGQQVAIYGDGFGDTQAQEGSIVRLGSPPDPTGPGPGLALGVVSWSTRSPNLHPANSGLATDPAITVTVPDEAESGSISVEETT